MLFIASVSKWAHYTGRASSSGTDWILNTENLFNVQTRSTTKSKGYYTENRYDRKKIAKLIHLEDTKASVLAAYDRTYDSNVITLPVYPDNNTDNSTVDRSIPVDSITRACQYESGDDYSYVYYNEGGGREIEILVPYSLQEIIDLADSGSTSTS